MDSYQGPTEYESALRSRPLPHDVELDGSSRIKLDPMDSTNDLSDLPRTHETADFAAVSLDRGDWI